MRIRSKMVSSRLSYSGLIVLLVSVFQLQVCGAVSKSLLVKVRMGNKSACGFIAKLDGKSYIITNTQLISGHDQLTFTTLSGETLKPLKLELSTTRDIARFLIDSNRGLEPESSVSEDEQVKILNYAQGSKVAEIDGVVTHLYEGRFRAESNFDAKNFGSPVINADGNVCGIATVINFYKKVNRSWEGSLMRTVYQLEDDTWFSPDWKKYNSSFGKSLRSIDEFRAVTYEMAGRWIEHPKDKIELTDDMSLEIARWAKQQNSLVNKITAANKKKSRDGNNNKGVAAAFRENCSAMVKICDSKVRSLDFLANQDKVTPYLKNEFKWRARELRTFSAFIRYHEKKTIERYWRD